MDDTETPERRKLARLIIEHKHASYDDEVHAAILEHLNKSGLRLTPEELREHILVVAEPDGEAMKVSIKPKTLKGGHIIHNFVLDINMQQIMEP